MRRLLGPAVLLALLVAGAAHAHTTGIHTGFVATVSGVDPPLPGLVVRVVGGHERLSVQNWTQATVVLYREDGGVAARLGPGEGAAWADPRIGWEGPPPDGETRLRDWRIEGEADGEPIAIEGFLGYRPAGAPAGTTPRGPAGRPGRLWPSSWAAGSWRPSPSPSRSSGGRARAFGPERYGAVIGGQLPPVQTIRPWMDGLIGEFAETYAAASSSMMFRVVDFEKTSG